MDALLPPLCDNDFMDSDNNKTDNDIEEYGEFCLEKVGKVTKLVQRRNRNITITPNKNNKNKNKSQTKKKTKKMKKEDNNSNSNTPFPKTLSKHSLCSAFGPPVDVNGLCVLDENKLLSMANYLWRKNLQQERMMLENHHLIEYLIDCKYLSTLTNIRINIKVACCNATSLHDLIACKNEYKAQIARMKREKNQKYAKYNKTKRRAAQKVENNSQNNANSVSKFCISQQALKFGCPWHDLLHALQSAGYPLPHTSKSFCNGYSVRCPCNKRVDINAKQLVQMPPKQTKTSKSSKKSKKDDFDAIDAVGLYYDRVSGKYSKNKDKYFEYTMKEKFGLIDVGEGFSLDKLSLKWATRTAQSEKQMKIRVETPQNLNYFEMDINVLRSADSVFEKQTRPGKWNVPTPKTYGTWNWIKIQLDNENRKG